jgi:hypothetical protein
MYFHNEMTIQELDQVRASFELLVQRNHLYYSSSGHHHMMEGSSSSSSTSAPGLEVYYPEGVILPTTTTSSNGAAPDTYSTTSNNEDDIEDDESHHHLLLTTAGRRLRELEIQLLESLRDSDEGIDPLVHLWTTERNAEASHALLQMQSSNQICSEGLVQEEANLAALCRNYPGWAEPWSRLATLLFYKGVVRWSDALSAAEEAIRIKPWHFEALNVCTLIQTQMNHPDNPSVIFGDDDSVADLRRRCHRLSRLSLPKLSRPTTGESSSSPYDYPKPSSSSSSSFSPSADALEARHVWVARAVATAQHQLQCAEQYTAAFRRRRNERLVLRPPPPAAAAAEFPPMTTDASSLYSAWQ